MTGAALQYAVIAAAGLVAIGTIAVMVIPNLRRIADALSGDTHLYRSTGTRDH